MIKWPFFEFLKAKPTFAPPPIVEPEPEQVGTQRKAKGFLHVGELIMEPEQIQLFQQ